ncbi:stage II sporulation protein M [Ideonella sp. BN130291]|uniref:stage II sporulation protein M n=1 Tax=Ideonella sp. BN130291 TaxID=3112940 RepID=UPI002E275965|nr:stage II sporulation protein M [Ideonella sp. BN130291]
MTPLQFEQAHAPLWTQLEAGLDHIERPGGLLVRSPRGPGAPPAGPLAPAELAALYRRCCEHLALARWRAYPVHLTDRLEALTQRAHQAIYRRHDYGGQRLKRLLLVDFPQAVRQHRAYMLVALLVFALPMLAAGWACWRDPGFVLSVVDASRAQNFDEMYSEGRHAIGRMRDASTDWEMFGFYVMNNVGVAFRCFAGGILAGVGSLFFLAYNGVLAGAIAGYLTARGHGGTFYSFVVTHSAFELTAILIAGAAGLRLGHALLAPGRLRRLQALQQAGAEAVVLVYGVVAMLLVAAFVEAFWSSAAWVAPSVKYGVGAACWAAVVIYLVWQGRPGAAAPQHRG